MLSQQIEHLLENIDHSEHLQEVQVGLKIAVEASARIMSLRFIEGLLFDRNQDGAHIEEL